MSTKRSNTGSQGSGKASVPPPPVAADQASTSAGSSGSRPAAASRSSAKPPSPTAHDSEQGEAPKSGAGEQKPVGQPTEPSKSAGQGWADPAARFVASVEAENAKRRTSTPPGPIANRSFFNATEPTPAPDGSSQANAQAALASPSTQDEMAKQSETAEESEWDPAPPSSSTLRNFEPISPEHLAEMEKAAASARVLIPARPRVPAAAASRIHARPPSESGESGDFEAAVSNRAASWPPPAPGGSSRGSSERDADRDGSSQGEMFITRGQAEKRRAAKRAKQSSVAEELDEDRDSIPRTPEQLERRRRLRRLAAMMLAAAAVLVVVGVLKLVQQRSSKAHPQPSAARVAQVEPSGAPQPVAANAATQPNELIAASSATAPVSDETSASASAAPAPCAAVSASAPPSAAEASSAPSIPDGVNPKTEALRLLNVGKYKAAIAMAQAAIDRDPQDAEPYLYLGAALQSSGHWKDGIAAYSRCVHTAKKGPVQECRAVGGH
jgi:hypothetical protein